MSDKTQNLSEVLFSHHKQAKETSALTQYMPSSQKTLVSKIEQDENAWYRVLRKMQWVWQGIDPLKLEEVLSYIAASTHSRTHDQWLDTVIGYRHGNWTFEWNRLGMQYQQNAGTLSGDAAAEELFTAALCFSIAGYPHLKNDNLSIQAQALANAAYSDAIQKSQYVIKQIDFPYQKRKIVGHLHLPHTERPLPIVIVTGGLDMLQTDMWRLFRDYLVEREIGMLTVDMPSVGYNSHWSLTQDTSVLHHAVLQSLPKLPWVDHHRVGLIGFRFGGNVMARLSFLAPTKVQGCVTLGAPIHDIFSSSARLKAMPKMYLDVLASRIGKSMVDIHSLSTQLNAWSLKTQGFFMGRKTAVPIFALGLEGDPISPYSDNQLVARYSRGGEAKEVKSKTRFHGYETALNLSVTWLEDLLTA